MKKYFYLLIFIALGFLEPLHAQIGTLGAEAAGRFGYKWTNNLNTANPATYNWIDISTIGTELTGFGDDNNIGPIQLGINFKFYWNTYSSCYVGANGYIMFDENRLIAQGQNGMPTIPSVGNGTGNFIAPFLADLTFIHNKTGENLKGAKAYFATLGSKFIITYDSVRFWNDAAAFQPQEASGLNTFQIVLDAADNSIVFNYKSSVGPYFTNPGASYTFITSGIENYSGVSGVTYKRNVLPPAQSSVKFVYPTNSTYSVKDIQARALFTFDNKAGTAFTNVPKTLKAFVKNSGTVKVKTPITARILVFDDLENGIYNQFITIDSLQLGEQKEINFPIPLSPGDTAASFKVQLRTTTAADAFATNNEVISKLIVLDSTQGSVDLKFTKAFTKQKPGIITDANQIASAGMVFDPPYSPMIIKQISADIIWPDTAAWATLNRPNVIDSLGTTLIEVYLGDGPGGSKGTLIDSFTIAKTLGSLEYDTVAFEDVSGVFANHVFRFKRTLPFPYLWDTDKRIYVGATHNFSSRFVWNAPYSEVYQPGTPSSGRSLELTAGVWGENRGKDSTDIGLGLIGDPITPAQFNFGLVDNKFCAGESFNMPFTTTGSFFDASNVFSLQLSSASGSFANPTVIGTLAGSAVGSIAAQLPANLVSGDGYKLRVVSSNPVFSGSPGNTVLYVGSPKQASAITGNTRFCPNDSNITYVAAGIGNARRYDWTLPADAIKLTGDTSNTITVKYGSTPGAITVTATNRCGVGPVKSQNVFVNSASVSQVNMVLTADAVSGASYQWFDNGVPIQGATNQKLNISIGGPYSVEVTFSTGCKITSPIVAGIEDILGTNSDLKIWPNPSRTSFNIGFGNASGKVKALVIRNSIGQLVTKSDYDNENSIQSVDVANWSSGIYYVRVLLSDGSKLQKNISVQK